MVYKNRALCLLLLSSCMATNPYESNVPGGPNIETYENQNEEGQSSFSGPEGQSSLGQMPYIINMTKSPAIVIVEDLKTKARHIEILQHNEQYKPSAYDNSIRIKDIVVYNHKMTKPTDKEFIAVEYKEPGNYVGFGGIIPDAKKAFVLMETQRYAALIEDPKADQYVNRYILTPDYRSESIHGIPTPEDVLDKTMVEKQPSSTFAACASEKDRSACNATCYGCLAACNQQVEELKLGHELWGMCVNNCTVPSGNYCLDKKIKLPIKRRNVC